MTLLQTHATNIYLQGFDFLHENRIAHCDFLEQNMGINILVDVYLDEAKGLREPSTTQYALYDFGYSLIYPPETALDDVKET